MFVRIVRNGKKMFKDQSLQEDSVYECARVFLKPIEDSAHAVGSVLVTIEKPNDSVSIEVVKDGNTEVYLMNNDGRTIDSYRWG